MNFPDRLAIFVAGAVAKALCHNVENITLSRSSVKRCRMQGRFAVAKSEEKTFLQMSHCFYIGTASCCQIFEGQKLEQSIALLFLLTEMEKQKFLVFQNEQRDRKSTGLCLHYLYLKVGY